MLCSAATLRALLTSGSFSLSSFSFSFLPHRDRAGAARAAFVKHFKALGVRGHTRLCQGSPLCQGSMDIPLAVPTSASPTTFLHY